MTKKFHRYFIVIIIVYVFVTIEITLNMPLITRPMRSMPAPKIQTREVTMDVSQSRPCPLHHVQGIEDERAKLTH